VICLAKEKKVKPVKEKKAKKQKEPMKPERTETGGLDYSVYYMSVPEKLGYTALAAAALFALGWIFYQSVPLAALMMIFAVKYPAIRTKEIIVKRREKLTLQFKDMLYSLSSALSAGNSVERSMTLVLEDMERQYADPKTPIIQELELIVSKLSINQNIEDLFADFGERSGIEDVVTFSQIFSVSKRTGGNLVQIIRQASDIITEKIETKAEINTTISGKKMEQKVVTVVPIALTFMFTQTMGDFMAPLFEGAGRLICTLALALIGIGYLWGKKLTDIEI